MQCHGQGGGNVGVKFRAANNKQSLFQVLNENSNMCRKVTCGSCSAIQFQFLILIFRCDLIDFVALHA